MRLIRTIIGAAMKKNSFAATATKVANLDSYHDDIATMMTLTPTPTTVTIQLKCYYIIRQLVHRHMYNVNIKIHVNIE